jgi:hypothetical protein
MKEVYSFALERIELERISYHVSAQINRAPEPDKIKEWTSPLDQFDAREILHVTFGSVSTEKTEHGKLRFYNDLVHILNTNREACFTNLENHL